MMPAHAPGLSFTPMREDDLDWVAAQEALLHPFPWSRNNFFDSLAVGHTCWLMSDGGAPVAYAVVLAVIDENHLLNISVARGEQGRGLGGRFLGHLLDEARRGDARRFFLEVRPSNAPALALYRRAGFVEIGRRKGYYPASGGREDAIVMRLDL
ncbi:MAG: ribosomal protein S18-alanine N-acetyltransferase [Azoarcus sp.]|jgi:ribosomal-protein-alanine N-acetyltransferase|nr:ribosomal protein S18-alanine N-acetyltransferase [Azoarcus sp.]